MKVLILGGDGYLGWPTAMYLSRRGYEVAVLDNMIKHFWEAEVGVDPLVQTRPMHIRSQVWEELTGQQIQTFVCPYRFYGTYTLFLLSTCQYAGKMLISC